MPHDMPTDLKASRLLLCNDDGILGPGLKALEAIAAALSDEVWICCPEAEQSAASHSLTINRPVRLRQLDPRRFTVDGTPTDCALLAINMLLKDKKPDLVLSGVNYGANLGEDTIYSGTVAAAMEAAILGVPAIALSQFVIDGVVPDWKAAVEWGPRILRRLVQIGWPEGTLMNVNFPAIAPDQVKGIRVARLGRYKNGDNLAERIDLRGRPYYWIGAPRETHDYPPDTDLYALAQGWITVTPLTLDLTQAAMLAKLEAAMAG